MPTEARFFATVAELRAWFADDHASDAEVWIGFFKAHARRDGVDYEAAVDEAVCVGWIDTTVRRIDDDRYAHRFTRRRPGSHWSASNHARIVRLRREGRLLPAGETAFANRGPDTPTYLSERPVTRWPAELSRRFRADRAAWRHFSAQTPSYRRLATQWVLSAVRPETRERRFHDLLVASRAGTRPRPFVVPRADRSGATPVGSRRPERPSPTSRRSRRRAGPAALK